MHYFFSSFQSVFRFMPSAISQLLPMKFHKWVLMLSVKIVVHGKQVDMLSLWWLIIGHGWIYLFWAIIEGYFVAKADIEGWPVFGYLAKLQYYFC